MRQVLAVSLLKVRNVDLAQVWTDEFVEARTSYSGAPLYDDALSRDLASFFGRQKEEKCRRSE